MPKTQSQFHRALWISDVHLGSPGCQAKRLVQFLKRNNCAQLYLVGDIFDGWKLKSNFYWTPDHSRVIKAIIAKARRGTEVYYLTGNHDEFMRQFVKNQLRFGRIRIGHEAVHTTADGRRLLIMHGDQFDSVVNGFRGLAFAGDLAYDVLMRANKWINAARAQVGLPYFSVSAFAKDHVKAVVQKLSGFDEAVLHQCRRRGFDGFVCGHSHHAEVRYLRAGVCYYNSGDWVESCTALAEDKDGNIRILQDSDAAAPALEKPPRMLPAPVRARLRKLLVPQAPVPPQQRPGRTPEQVLH